MYFNKTTYFAMLALTLMCLIFLFLGSFADKRESNENDNGDPSNYNSKYGRVFPAIIGFLGLFCLFVLMIFGLQFFE